jgi:YYY domain-containing protein
VQGHLEGLLEVLHKRGLLPSAFWTWLDIRDLKIPPAGPGASWLPDRFIWWWRGSRVLTDYTLTGHEQEVIDEFPFFSFLLGDVHPHVLALPFVLLAVALALNLLAAPLPEDRPGLPLWRAIWRDLTAAMGGRLAFGLYAVTVGGLSFLNTWDFPIYLGVIGLSFLAWQARQSTENNRPQNNLLLNAAIGTGMLAAVGVLLYLPFYATFQSQARGLLPNLWNPTRLPQFVVFFGPFLLAVLGLLTALSAGKTGWRRHLRWSLPLAVLGPLLVMLMVLSGLLFSPAGRDYVQSILNHPEVQAALGDTTVSALVLESLRRRAVNPWTFLFLGGLAGWTLALGMPRLTGSNRDTPVTFSLILLLMGLALPLAVEFVYLRDNFGIRMNTIFKFYFQAWVLLALASAYGVYYVSHTCRGWAKLAWQVGLAGLVAAGLIYPVLASADKTNYFQNRPTLNGIQWVADYRPGDYAAIAWLRANAPNNAVILETPGAQYAAYQYTGRMSALTGLPTLLGWGGHQSQWRSSYDEPARREPDIETLFNTTNLAQARQLLDKYNITYVVVGGPEREKYAPPGLEKFARLMDVAFQQDDVIVYQKR